MKNENSYAELTKAYRLANLQKKEKQLQLLYIDSLIHEAILKEKRHQLMMKIDEAIDQNNRAEFHKLAGELNKIDIQLNA